MTDYYDRKAEQSKQQVPALYWFVVVGLTAAMAYVIVAKMVGG